MSNNGYVATYIPDGYTQNAYLRPRTGLHGEIRFSYRPMLVTTQGQVLRDFQDAAENPARQQEIAAEWICRYVVSWNIQRPDGKPVNCKDVNDVLHLRPSVFNRIWSIILGDEGGDVDPQERPEEKRRRTEMEAEVVAAGKTREELDGKN